MLLHGQRKIMEYTGRSWKTLVALKRRDNFPMEKICGRWESSTEAIDEWRFRKFRVTREEVPNEKTGM